MPCVQIACLECLCAPEGWRHQLDKFLIHVFHQTPQPLRSRCPQVWRIASGGVSKQKLERDDWLVACKLVAAVQHKGTEPAMSSVIGMIPDLPM